VRDAFGAALVRCGEADASFVVLDADNGPATRLAAFARRFPERFFNVGCAEQALVGVAGGLALAGVPVVASTFAIFLVGRAFEQIRNTLCMGDLPVTLVGTHAGVTVGYDGASHFCVEDLALMRAVPGMTVLVPSSGPQVQPLLELALASRRPAYLRISRHGAPASYPVAPVRLGGAELVRRGRDVTVLACGLMVERAVRSAAALVGEDVEVEVDAYSLKPLDADTVRGSAARTGAVVTVEEHGPYGGLAEAVAGVLAESDPVPLERVCLPDSFAGSGDPAGMLDRYGLSVAAISGAVRRVLARARGGSPRRG
jgi:transketolase